MDFNGDKGSPTMEAALVELEKMRADTGFLGIHAIPMVEDLIKRMRVIDSIDWLEHLVVALQAFTASEVYAVIRAIPMTLRPMRAHSYRCKTYRGSSLPFDETDECTCGYRKQREERLGPRDIMVVLDPVSPALDACKLCGHARVFHQVGTGNGVPVGVGYCDDRHGEKCTCKAFVPLDAPAPPGPRAADALTPLDELVPRDRHGRFCFQEDLDYATRAATAFATCCHQHGMVGANGVDDRVELVSAHLQGFASGVSYYAAQVREHRQAARRVVIDPYEYAMTSGPRKASDPSPPDPGDGPAWEPDPNRGRPGESWERFDYHEEYYWRRLRQGDKR